MIFCWGWVYKKPLPAVTAGSALVEAHPPEMPKRHYLQWQLEAPLLKSTHLKCCPSRSWTTTPGSWSWWRWCWVGCWPGSGSRMARTQPHPQPRPPPRGPCCTSRPAAGGGPWGTHPRTQASKSRYYCTRWLQIYRRWPLGYAPYNTSKSRYYCTRWLVDLQAVALGVRTLEHTQVTLLLYPLVTDLQSVALGVCALEHTQASHVITVPVGCRFTGGGPWGMRPRTHTSKSRYYCTCWLQIYRGWPLGYAP